MEYAWNWAAIQLDGGVDLSVATLVDPRVTPHKLMEKRAIVIDKDGVRSQPEDLEFAELNSWTSVRSFNSYPTKWQVTIPSAGIDLFLSASFDDQEFVTLIARPGFWEGRVRVTGTLHGQSVTGVGYVERNGFGMLSELDSFFKAVGKATRSAVTEVYPDTVTRGESGSGGDLVGENEGYYDFLLPTELQTRPLRSSRHLKRRGTVTASTLTYLKPVSLIQFATSVTRAARVGGPMAHSPALTSSAATLASTFAG